MRFVDMKSASDEVHNFLVQGDETETNDGMSSSILLKQEYTKPIHEIHSAFILPCCVSHNVAKDGVQT